VNIPMDNQTARVIELVPRDCTEPMVAVKKRDFSKRECDHGNFRVDTHNRTVECGKCGQPLDAMHVLTLIAQSESRRRWMLESYENHVRKENEKTIKAAVIALGKRDVGPERFADLYEKYVSGPTSPGPAPISFDDYSPDKFGG
jgi:hypothetical protein